MYKKFFSFLFVLFASFLVPFLNAGNENIVLTIFQTTDIHGEEKNIPVIGTLLRQVRAQAPENSVLAIDCGDITQGTFFAAYNKGSAMITALNAFHYDIFVPGNHEFDFGIPVFIRNIEQFQGDVLAANLVLNLPCSKKILPWKIYMRAGLKIAVIGAAPPYMSLWFTNNQLQDIVFSDLDSMLAQTMPQVRAAKPDFVILALHAGEFSAGRLNANGKARHIGQIIKLYPEISLVLGGHTHLSVPGKKLLRDTWYVQAPPHGTGAALIQCSFHPESHQLLDISSEILSAEHIFPCDMPEKWNRAVESASKLGKKDFAFIPEGKSEEVSSLAYFVRAVSQFTDIPVCATGPYTSWKLLPGPVTRESLFRLIPFENHIVVLSLTNMELKQILNEQKQLKNKKDALVFHGLDKVNSRGRTKVGFTSYTISGGGGRYPELKRIAESGTVSRQELDITIRQAVEWQLAREYPLPSGK